MVADQAPNKHHFIKTPVIPGHRLVLKEISFSDVSSIIEISVYDGVFAEDEAGGMAILKQINADVANGDSYHWGIFLKETNKLVGTCGYYRGFSGKCGEIGYLLNSSARGRGFMTEAIKLMVAFGFETLGLTTVVAYTDPTNLASIGVLQRTGFHQVNSNDHDLKFEKYPL